MNTLVVYDSNYGNTKEVAEEIASILNAKAVSILEINSTGLTNIDFLVVGTPIIGWKPTDNMQRFLSGLSSEQLKNVKVTTFDTRVKLFIHGDAMGKVADALRNVGAKIIVDPMPFYVSNNKQNPTLLSGELEKARIWAKEIKNEITKE